MFADPLLRQVFDVWIENPDDDLQSLVDSVPGELADAIGQLAVLEEPTGEAERLVGQFVHDAALRRVTELQREAQRSGDPVLMPAIAELRLRIPEVRAANFDLTVATGLVPLLSNRGAP